MSDNLRKKMQNINLGINDEPVSLPPEVCVQAAATNQFSVVVVLLNPKKQNLRVMVTQLPRLWGFKNSIFGRIIGPNKLQFRFQSEQTLNLVLRRSPWSFAEWMITVHRWSLNLPIEAQKVIPFWIQIKGIPIQYLTRPMIGFIGNTLAPVVEIDYDNNSTRVDFVRGKALWNTDEPLRF